MDKQGKIPVTMRILAALGMLEGRGILPTILIILMVVIGLAVFIYQGSKGLRGQACNIAKESE